MAERSMWTYVAMIDWNIPNVHQPFINAPKFKICKTYQKEPIFSTTVIYIKRLLKGKEPIFLFAFPTDQLLIYFHDKRSTSIRYLWQWQIIIFSFFAKSSDKERNLMILFTWASSRLNELLFLKFSWFLLLQSYLMLYHCAI